jgi:hypothetical protein
VGENIYRSRTAFREEYERGVHVSNYGLWTETAKMTGNIREEKSVS